MLGIPYGSLSVLEGCLQERREMLFTKAYSDGTRGNGFRLKEGRFRLDIKNIFTVQTEPLWCWFLVALGVRLLLHLLLIQPEVLTLAASALLLASSKSPQCSLLGKSLTLHVKQKYQFLILLF